MLIRRALAATAVIAVAAGAMSTPAATANGVDSGTLTTAASDATAGGLIQTKANTASATPASSGSGFASVGGCSFYANSSSAGGWCGASGVTGVAESLAEWLHGRTFYSCQFVDVPPDMDVNVESKPGGRWMLRVCFTDVDLQRPWGGRDTNVDVYLQWVPDDQPIDIPDYMEQFWNYQDQVHYYPTPRIIVGPSGIARVGAYTYFWAHWVDKIDGTTEVKPAFNAFYNSSIGTLRLHAEIDHMTFHPGLEDMEAQHPGGIDCGKADVEFDPNLADAVPAAEGGSQPSTCYDVYTHSTASRDEHNTVQIRFDTYWTVGVYDQAGNLVRSLGTFHYVAKQRMAVAEVQSLAGW